MDAGERIFAFLDDIYAVCSKPRAACLFNHVSSNVEQYAGIKPNLGKFVAWSRGGGPAPEGIPEKAWRNAEEGKVILGSPLGSVKFCKNHAEKRMQSENEFLSWIPKLPDLQSA